MAEYLSRNSHKIAIYFILLVCSILLEDEGRKRTLSKSAIYRLRVEPCSLG